MSGHAAANKQAARRVLVTGATSVTGTRLVRALIEEGCQVRALVRQRSAVTALLSLGVELVVGDIRDARAVDEAVRGCSQVFHLAALYRESGAKKEDYWAVHVTGTEHVLAACERHQVKRLIHCSTMGVHGHVGDAPVDETAPINPSDEYQRTKWIAEERVWAVFKRTGLPTTVIRPAGIYGPGELRFLKLFHTIREGYFVMLGSGRTLFHPVHLDDLVEGFLRAATHPAAIGEAFCIAGDRSLTLNAFAAAIAQAVGVPKPRWHLPVWPVYAAGALCEAACMPFGLNPPLYRRRVGFFTHSRAFRTDKARQLIGYQPRIALEEGLAQTARWYESHGYLRPQETVARVEQVHA